MIAGDGNLNRCFRREGNYKELNRPTVFHTRLGFDEDSAYRNRLSASTVFPTLQQISSRTQWRFSVMSLTC